MNNSIWEDRWQNRFPKKNGDSQASPRVEALEHLLQKTQQLIDGAADAVYQNFPSYAATSQSREEYTYKIRVYQRKLIYCLFANSTEPFDRYIIERLKEDTYTYNLFPSNIIEALNYIKANHGLTGQAAFEFNRYIDYALNVIDGLRQNQETEHRADDRQDGKPFWQRIVELGAQVPEEEWKKLPKDFARNFEHYMYDAPKEE